MDPKIKKQKLNTLSKSNTTQSLLPFSNWVLKKQRSHLIDALVVQGEDDQRRLKGRKIMSATRRMLTETTEVNNTMSCEKVSRLDTFSVVEDII